MTTPYWQQRLNKFYKETEGVEYIDNPLAFLLSEMKQTLKEGRDYLVEPERIIPYHINDNEDTLRDRLDRVDTAVMIGLSILDE